MARTGVTIGRFSICWHDLWIDRYGLEVAYWSKSGRFRKQYSVGFRL